MTDANDPPPGPPVRPDDEDCCRSGCEHCVFERYEDALERYEAQLRAWEQRQRAKGTLSVSRGEAECATPQRGRDRYHSFAA